MRVHTVGGEVQLYNNCCYFFQAVVMPCPCNKFVCQGQEDDNQIVDCLKCSCFLILWVYIVY